VFLRNVLDDMRLSLELLLKAVLGNDKSLENQIPQLGGFIKEKGLPHAATSDRRRVCIARYPAISVRMD
jgi:hypothetical protein